MNYKAHATGSAIAGVAVTAGWYFAAGIPLEFSWMAFPATFAGGNFPDLDTSSTPSKAAAKIGALTSLFLIVIGVHQRLSEMVLLAAIMGFLFFAVKASTHRGFTHKYYLPIIFIAMAFYLPFRTDFIPLVLASFGIGILVHFLLDKIWPWSLQGWRLS